MRRSAGPQKGVCAVDFHITLSILGAQDVSRSAGVSQAPIIRLKSVAKKQYHLPASQSKKIELRLWGDGGTTMLFL